MSSKDTVKKWLNSNPSWRKVLNNETVKDGDRVLSLDIMSGRIKNEFGSLMPKVCSWIGRKPKNINDGRRLIGSRLVFFRNDKQAKQKQKKEYKLGWWICKKSKHLNEQGLFLKNKTVVFRYKDRQPHSINKWSPIKREIRLCEKGYHASDKIVQALDFFSGSDELDQYYFCRVIVRGPFKIDKGNKFVGRSRKILEIYDGSKVFKNRTISSFSQLLKSNGKTGWVWSNPDQSLYYVK